MLCGKELTVYHTMPTFKGGYLDFSHHTELKKIYITEMYLKKQKKSSITKNCKIKTYIFFENIPLTLSQMTDFRLFQTERLYR